MRERDKGQRLFDSMMYASRKIEKIWREADLSSEESLDKVYESVEATLSQGTGRDLIIALFEKEIDPEAWDMVYAGLYHYKAFHIPRGLPKLATPETYFLPPTINPKSSFSES